MAHPERELRWDLEHTEAVNVSWRFQPEFDVPIIFPGFIRVCRSCRGSREFCRCAWRSE